MQTNLISDYRKIDFNQWDEFVKNHPDGTIFQSSDMYSLFKNTRNFDPVPIVAMEDGKITGLMLAIIIKEFSGCYRIFFFPYCCLWRTFNRSSGSSFRSNS